MNCMLTKPTVIRQAKVTILNQFSMDEHKGYFRIATSSKNIERVLYIGDTLYTVSKGMIKANELSGLKEVKALSIGE